MVRKPRTKTRSLRVTLTGLNLNLLFNRTRNTRFKNNGSNNKSSIITRRAKLLTGFYVNGSTTLFSNSKNRVNTVNRVTGNGGIKRHNTIILVRHGDTVLLSVRTNIFRTRPLGVKSSPYNNRARHVSRSVLLLFNNNRNSHCPK